MSVLRSIRGKLLFIGTVLCCALFLFGCGKPRNPADLYGTYVADYKAAKERLILGKDGTFTQEVAIKATSKVNVAKGTWSYDPKSSYITFDNSFMVVLNGFREFNPNYASPKTGYVLNLVGRSFGKITIGIGESGIVYQKL